MSLRCALWQASAGCRGMRSGLRAGYGRHGAGPEALGDISSHYENRPNTLAEEACCWIKSRRPNCRGGAVYSAPWKSGTCCSPPCRVPPDRAKISKTLKSRKLVAISTVLHPEVVPPRFRPWHFSPLVMPQLLQPVGRRAGGRRCHFSRFEEGIFNRETRTIIL